jgi:RNA polymerase sigma-70 factor (ECF subfamily)
MPQDQGCNDGSGTQHPASEVTRLLLAWSSGDRMALDRLAPLVEHELRRLAQIYMKREGSGHTLQPTALVNEAYLRLIEWQSVDWQGRAHFFAVAARMMRNILVTHAVSRQREKRGGGAVLVSLDPDHHAAFTDKPGAEILALEEALKKLAKFDERKCQVVELRFFGGLSEEETAEVLGTPLRTVQREWNLARAWLFRELK